MIWFQRSAPRLERHILNPIHRPSLQVTRFYPCLLKLHQYVDIGPVSSTNSAISSQIIVPCTERMSSLKVLPTPLHSPFVGDAPEGEKERGSRFCAGVAAAFVHNSSPCERCSVLASLSCPPPQSPQWDPPHTHLHWVILQAAAGRLWSTCAGLPPGPGWIALDLFNLFRSSVRRFEATHLSINHNLSPCSQLLWNATSAFESPALQLVRQHQ